MKKYRNIYVAATRQHVGKTTSTLGLVSSFLHRGINVGYCKPVGQKHLRDRLVDKDTLLFADLIKFDIEPDIHSPIILPGKEVKRIIKEPMEAALAAKVVSASETLEQRHEMTIYEGTGHPGVGSVAGLSNAKVAKLIDAGVIMVVPGGVGRTIDIFNMSTALFREEGVPIIGVIVNKVFPDKIPQTREYVSRWLKRKNIPLLGIMPYDPTLAYPLMSTVARSIKAQVEYNEHKLDNQVESTLAGSLVDLDELQSFQNQLLIASTRTIERAIQKVKKFSRLDAVDDSPLSGVIVTGEGELEESVLDYINEHELPLLRSSFDTYGAVLKISRIEVKINRHTPWKVTKAIDMIKENVDLDYIFDTTKL